VVKYIGLKCYLCAWYLTKTIIFIVSWFLSFCFEIHKKIEKNLFISQRHHNFSNSPDIILFFFLLGEPDNYFHFSGVFLIIISFRWQIFLIANKKTKFGSNLTDWTKIYFTLNSFNNLLTIDPN
jgi:hypothetical protein